MSIATWPADAGGVHHARLSEARLPAAVTRPCAFLLLALFGGRAWARMVEPAAGGALTASTLAALGGAALLVAVAGRRLGRAPRAGVTLVVAAALLLVALLAAGVPAHYLRPRAWDELAAGINQGLGTVPNVRVPYHGVDEWTRSVIVLGATVLVGLAAVLAFLPRRDGAFGLPLVAAIPLTTLYLVPVMQRDTPHQFWSGALFTILLVAFLWLERVEWRTVPLAAGFVAAAIFAGLVLGPGLDRDTALLDYEGLAQTLSAGAGDRFDWDHAYAPLDPRVGREVLRVAAPRRAYWKATNLTTFDGSRWLHAGDAPGTGLDETLPARNRRWIQSLRVTLRGLTSTQFIAAGRTMSIDRSPRDGVESGAGTFTTKGRPLRRGNAYLATVYTPSPSKAELRAATLQPLTAAAVGSGLTAFNLPAERGSIGPTTHIVLPAWGDGDPSAGDVKAIEASPYAGVYDLARRLRDGARTPYDFMLAIEQHLTEGFVYSERPRRSSAPLADFLLRTRRGYCQQFSGAMALLLRMGGVPARVAAGFSPGSLDPRRHEYVVRDMDAHSWVEVDFPGIGWVTRDPTPGDAPARSQTSDVVSTGSDAAAAPRDASAAAIGRRIRPDGAGGAAPEARQDGSSLPIAAIVLAALVAAAGVALAVLRRRRRSRDDEGQLAELRRALRRSGRQAGPPTTLESLARRWQGTPAEGYVRVLTAARYGYGDGRPSPAQRAGLRRELAAGGGLRGHLRAWWALPPRVARGGR
jgi:hypothetical protein